MSIDADENFTATSERFESESSTSRSDAETRSDGGDADGGDIIEEGEEVEPLLLVEPVWEADGWDATCDAADEVNQASTKQHRGPSPNATSLGSKVAPAAVEEAEGTEPPESTGSSTLTSPSRAGEVALRRSRSGRQIAPKRSLLLAMDTPLLKWEKQQQQRDKKVSKGAAGGPSHKVSRASSFGGSSTNTAAPYDTDSGDALHEDSLNLAGSAALYLPEDDGLAGGDIVSPTQRVAKRQRL